ncbi:MAG: hypothetical protein ACOYKJ_01315 [Candidatus Howiella sp.]|jgi:hypothetical protein
MPKGDRRAWRRLDNAAKIFPSTSEQSDTRVFRFSAELTEPVDPAALQTALEQALELFPLFRCVMRRGAFWYYLEECDLTPRVGPEVKSPCMPLYDGNHKSLLFDVTYYKTKINLEFFHVLTDGTGAISFLTTLLHAYLSLRHPEAFAGVQPPQSAPVSEKAQDGFAKYYQKGGRRAKGEKSALLRGAKREGDTIRILDARVPADQIRRLAASHDATVTVFLSALFILSIGENLSLNEKKRPVVLNIPVNLRNYFPSDTATNFFGMISTGFRLDHTPSLEEVISVVSADFKTELTSDKLAGRMRALTALEHNPAARIAPLPLKNFVLRQARHIADRRCTAVLSNVGVVRLPEEMVPYIRSMGAFTSTLKLQLCLCTCGNVMSLGFTSAFESPAIERCFLRRLAEFGVDIEVSTNEF